MPKFLIVLISLAARLAFGNDLYVVQGAANGQQIARGQFVMWSADAAFFNTGSTDAALRLIGVSNGGRIDSSGGGVVAAQRSVSIGDLGVRYSVDPPNTLWVLRFDAAPEIQGASALFIGTFATDGPAPITRPFELGKLQLPVYRTLVPAGQRQVHLLTSLGPASTNPVQVQVPSRINVAVYNAGAKAANATIELHQHCDDAVVTTRTVIVPADTVVQVGPVDARTTSCGTPGYAVDLFTYTVVTIDQPGFSFVSNLSNATVPTASISITANP